MGLNADDFARFMYGQKARTWRKLAGAKALIISSS